MEYHIDIFDNHLILLDREARFLIDTGAPFSISNESEINLFGQIYRTSQNYLGLTIDELSREVGCELNALIGGDILKNHRFQVDFRNRLFSITDELTPEDTEDCISLELFMDIPIIEIGLGQNTIKGFLDTGAKISYLKSAHVEEFAPTGNREDFYPTYGRFKTPIYELPVKLNNREIILKFGVLPRDLEAALSMGNTEAIIGNGIFSYYSVIFDYSNEKFYLR